MYEMCIGTACIKCVLELHVQTILLPALDTREPPRLRDACMSVMYMLECVICRGVADGNDVPFSTLQL